MLKVKENVEMIKEIRKYIIGSLKSRDVTTVHADLANIVLIYDYDESVYDNPKNKDEVLNCIDIDSVNAD